VVAADAIRLVRAQPTGPNLVHVSATANPLNNRAFDAVFPALRAMHPNPDDITIVVQNNAAPVIGQLNPIGSFGQALQFDGINDFVISPNLAPILGVGAPRASV